jgi:hypothetical protein
MAIGVIWESRMATTALQTTAQATPFVRRENGGQEESCYSTLDPSFVRVTKHKK